MLVVLKNMQIIKLLIDYGRTIDIKNNIGNTALIEVCGIR